VSQGRDLTYLVNPSRPEKKALWAESPRASASSMPAEYSCEGYIFRRSCHSTVTRDKVHPFTAIKGKGRVPEVAPFIYFDRFSISSALVPISKSTNLSFSAQSTKKERYEIREARF
jgi:hypothetical protein